MGVKSAGPAGEPVAGDNDQASEHEKKVLATQGQTEDPDAASGASHSKSELQGDGDTTHLGFVKRGKKLLPMHPPEHGNKTEGPE